MTYQDAVTWLLSLPDSERGAGARPSRESLLLERPRALVGALGSPQTTYRSVLVAGTKGKGSTAAMLESILRAAGLRTGLYTSPHLHTYRERIRVNGELIGEQDLARGAGELEPQGRELIAQHPDFESLSTFEVMTALALYHFAQAKVDVAILEVGVGGRLDATNVVDADLSLITPISFDHTAVLGNTLPKIAFEKAGIIKPGKVVLSAPQAQEAAKVIAAVAENRYAVLGVGERDWIWLGGHEDFMVAGVPHPGLWNDYWHYPGLHVPLLGTHQFVNAALAVAAFKVIQENWNLGNRLSGVGADAPRKGLESTKWHGRMEVLQQRDATHTLILTDGAHNGDSAEKLVDALKIHFQFNKVYLIFGVLADKELDAIARPLAEITAFAWTVTTNHPRARDAKDTAQALHSLGMQAQAADSFPQALAGARAQAAPRDVILITGSLSIVAQAREAFGLATERD